ncbi:MAG: hypothetical protein WDZ59_08255 [Pirellulales bacterium]
MTIRCTLFIIGLSLTAIPVRAQSVSSVAQHAPADTYLAIASGDVAATCQEFQGTSIGQMLAGADFVPLIDELRRRESAGPLHLRPAFGFDWDELQQLHAAGGLFIFPMPGDKQGAAWIFGGTPSTEASNPWASAGQYFQSKGFSRSSERRGAATLTVFRPPQDSSYDEVPAQFLGDGFYGLANSPTAAAAVLDVRRKSSLATTAAWQQTVSEGNANAPGDGDVAFVIRPMELWQLLRRAEEERQASGAEPSARELDVDEPSRDPLASSRRLGFGGVTSLAGRASFPAEAELDWGIHLRVTVEQPLPNALRLLQFESGPMPPLPEWIGADVTSMSFWRWDFPTAMKGYGNLFDEANEPGPDGLGLFEDMLDGLRDDPEGVQVDLRRDVFAQLGPTILNITDRKGVRTERQPNGDRTLYVVEVRDIEKLSQALSDFYRGDNRVTSTQQGAYRVWDVPEGASLFVEGESDSVVSVRVLALGENRMLFGTDVDLLQTALTGRSDGDRLNDDATWSRLWHSLRARHGDIAAMWALARLGQVLEPSYIGATSQQASDDEQPPTLTGTLWRIVLFGTADEEAEVPLAAAPNYARVRTSLPRAGMVIKPTDGGWTVDVDAQREDTAP